MTKVHHKLIFEDSKLIKVQNVLCEDGHRRTVYIRKKYRTNHKAVRGEISIKEKGITYWISGTIERVLAFDDNTNKPYATYRFRRNKSSVNYFKLDMKCAEKAFGVFLAPTLEFICEVDA